MLLDKQNEYSNSQAVTGTVVSTNVIDHTAVKPGLGAGREMMIALFLEAQTNATAAITVNLQTDDNAAFSSATTIATMVIATTEIVAGSRFFLPIPPNYKSEQFTRLQFVAGASAVTMSSYLVPQDFQSQYYATPASVTSI